MGDRNEFRLNQGDEVLANDEFLRLIMVGSGRGEVVVDCGLGDIGDLALCILAVGLAIDGCCCGGGEGVVAICLRKETVVVAVVAGVADKFEFEVDLRLSLANVLEER